jgi:hypothetical protein
MSRALKSHVVSEVANTGSCITVNEVHAAVSNKVQPAVSHEFEALAANAVDSAET